MVLQHVWEQLFRSGQRSSRRQGQRLTSRLGAAHVEPFESRSLLSISSVFSAGPLSIASDGADGIAVAADVDGNVTLNGTTLMIPIDGTPTAVAASSVMTLNVTGGALKNVIDLSGVTAALFTSLTSVSVDGGMGNDNITGSDFADNILGSGGNDLLKGGVGNDTLGGAVATTVWVAIRATTCSMAVPATTICTAERMTTRSPAALEMTHWSAGSATIR